MPGAGTPCDSRRFPFGGSSAMMHPMGPSDERGTGPSPSASGGDGSGGERGDRADTPFSVPAPPPVVVTPRLPTPLPRLGPTLLITLFTIPGLVAVSGIFLVVPFLLSGEAFDPEAFQAWTEEFVGTFRGLLWLLVPGQLFLMALAVGPALLSRVPVRRRLSLVPSRLGAGGTIGLAVGTVAGTIPYAIGANWVIEKLDISMPDTFGTLLLESSGLQLVALVAVLSVVPGVCEELLFRGYILTRFFERWSARRSIAVAAVAFSVIHFQPVLVITVFPLALWLGFITWRSGSVLPAMGAHAANNVAALVVGRNMMGIVDGDPTTWLVLLASTGICAVLLMRGLGRLAHLPAPPQPHR